MRTLVQPELFHIRSYAPDIPINLRTEKGLTDPVGMGIFMQLGLQILGVQVWIVLVEFR